MTHLDSSNPLLFRGVSSESSPDWDRSQVPSPRLTPMRNPNLADKWWVGQSGRLRSWESVLLLGFCSSAITPKPHPNLPQGSVNLPVKPAASPSRGKTTWRCIGARTRGRHPCSESGGRWGESWGCVCGGVGMGGYEGVFLFIGGVLLPTITTMTPPLTLPILQPCPYTDGPIITLCIS